MNDDPPARVRSVRSRGREGYQGLFRRRIRDTLPSPFGLWAGGPKVTRGEWA